MASTGKTPNLKLSQWVLSDPFLMEDMNADNAKIDTAVAALPYVKLMDITTGADAQQVDLDVSGIDLSRYTMVQIFSNAICRDTEGYANNRAALKIRINGFGGMFDVEGSSNNQYCDYVAYADQSSYSTCPLQITISGFQQHSAAGKAGSYYNTLAAHCAGGSYPYPCHSVSTCNIGGQSDRMSRVNFLAAGESGYTFYIKAGSRFVMYGVKL